MDGSGEDVNKECLRTIPRNMGQGGRMMPQTPCPSSSDVRLSTAARTLREESAGCVYGATGQSYLFCFPYRKGREKGREIFCPGHS